MSDVISSRIVGVEELLQLGFFAPAAVQRDFQWREPQSEQMLKDIFEAMHESQTAKGNAAEVIESISVHGDNEPEAGIQSDDEDDSVVAGISRETSDLPEAVNAFFLGSIILYPAGDGAYEIFDGLQRLSTVTILIAVLRDKSKDEQLKRRLHALIADPSSGRFRLSHRGNDPYLPEMVLAPGEAGKVRFESSRPEGAAGQRLFDVARQFRKSISVRNQLRISAIARFLLEHVRISVVFIRNRRQARQTFIATNLYGVPLSRADIFKGELLSLARDETELEAVEGVWNRVLESVGRDGRAKGADNEPKMGPQFEQFLACCDMIERRQPQTIDCLGDLITHLSRRAEKGQLLDWLAGFERLAEAWVELERTMQAPEAGRGLDYHIWTLNFFKWQEWRPLALYWMARHLANAPHGTTLWRFDMLSRRCMALTLLELDQATRARMFLEAMQAAVRNRRPFDHSTRWLPLNFSKTYRDRVWDALNVGIDHYEVRRALMLWYEASMWGPGAPLYIRSASVEHILPGRCGPRSQWLQDFPDAQKRYLAHASLGNLAMIDRRLQEPLANLDFAGKGGKKEQLAGAGQFEKYRSLGGVDKIDRWLPGIIQARTELAAMHIWTKLGLGDVGAAER